MPELPKTYEPRSYEDDIYRKWEASGFFNPDNLKIKNDAPAFTIVLPPPNVTGTLHMGHAAMLAVEDILIRYHRMLGDRTLWVPGTDHAAIATQTKVEKLIKDQGETRHSLGREKFLEKVRQFAQESHDTIIDQCQKMGASCDWSREAYTLDETRHKAVYSVFKMMYDDGLIYRGERIVNWCPRCHSTLADDEVEYRAEKSKLYWIKYGPFVLATTRPETKLGDTAVAVYPGDERYKDMIGKKYMIPGVLGEFEITVVADRAVDPEFGSGAIKVTPAHDFADYDIAQRHGLKMKKIIDEDGRMMDNCGKYAGMTTREARSAIVEDMEKMGLIDHIDDYEHNTALCYRCDTVIEPIPSKQWFIDVNKSIPKYGKSIKELSVGAVQNGVFGRKPIKILPNRFEKNYYHWMENLRDWCISRQIWFGHRIPVWYRESGKLKVESGKTETGNNSQIKLILVRHTQTDWNVQGIMQGQKDIPLNATGEEQAQELAEKLKAEKVDVIISSPASRTMRTAAAVNTWGVEIIQDKRLLERSYGKFEGQKRSGISPEASGIKVFEKNGKSFWMDVPSGESYQDVLDRVNDFLAEIRQKYAGKTIMIMSHEDPLDMLCASLDQASIEDAIGSFGNNGYFKHYDLKSADMDQEEIYVGTEAPEGTGWLQDEDTLDTWFSSGLWTFSTLANLPEQIKLIDADLAPGVPSALGTPGAKSLIVDSADFRRFHPISVMETGYDILFFWVARMIIMTTYAVGDIPFQDVYLHGLVLDDKGKKMSKSKGNVIDPLTMKEAYGADATRLSLVIGSTPGNDLKLSEEKVAGYRNLVNKLWNIYRFAVNNWNFDAKNYELDNPTLTQADLWFIAKFQILVKQISDDLDNYRFSQAGERLREFTWNTLADWYLEICKLEKNLDKQKIIPGILENLLILWHPFIPFVTEVLWREIGNEDLLMVQKWPKGAITEKFTTNFDMIISIITAIRNARSENGVEPANKIKALIYTKEVEFMASQSELIKGLRTGIEELEIRPLSEKADRGDELDKAVMIALGDTEIYLLIPIDEAKEKERIEKEISNLESLIQRTESLLSSEDFINRAPAPIVLKEKDRLEKWRIELDALKNR